MNCQYADASGGDAHLKPRSPTSAAEVGEFRRMLSHREWQFLDVAALVGALTESFLVQLTPKYRNCYTS